jgi:hypothetical protein
VRVPTYIKHHAVVLIEVEQTLVLIDEVSFVMWSQDGLQSFR